jgi:methylthioribulose-1-phosphate dehydratase
MSKHENTKKTISKWIRQVNKKNWSPGTSTNYSFKHSSDDTTLYISKSGIDKGYFSENDFMEVDKNGKPLINHIDCKSSAETNIHCVLYGLFPETACILHSHSKAATLLSAHFKKTNGITFVGYEVLKGLPNIDSHESKVFLPIFENTQDMEAFGEILKKNANQLSCHGFLMEKHGIYTWGKDFLSAKRHLEIFEFLLDCELTLLQIHK